MNSGVKPITPREVRERIKERYSIPEDVIQYINERILLSFNSIDGTAFLKWYDFSTHFANEGYPKTTVLIWFNNIPNVFNNDWCIAEKDIDFEYSRLYNFKERKKR